MGMLKNHTLFCTLLWVPHLLHTYGVQYMNNDITAHGIEPYRLITMG